MTETHYLIDILVLLAAAVMAVPVFHRLGLGSVLGYLTAGAVVGSWGFGLIDPVEEKVIRHITRFGVLFFLFLIAGANKLLWITKCVAIISFRFNSGVILSTTKRWCYVSIYSCP